MVANMGTEQAWRALRFRDTVDGVTTDAFRHGPCGDCSDALGLHLRVSCGEADDGANG